MEKELWMYAILSHLERIAASLAIIAGPVEREEKARLERGQALGLKEE